MLLTMLLPVSAAASPTAAPAGAPSTPASASDSLGVLQYRPRVIATTDGERDDLASMHRFILYTNDLDVIGIVQSSSQFHHSGDKDAIPPISSTTWLGSDWIHAIIRNYAEAYPMLVQNDPRYPTPEYLHSVVKVGNITDVGEFAKNTEGSEWIKQILLDDNPAPVYISIWGGTNTVAATLRSIRDQYYGTPEWDAIYQKVCAKAWIIVDLDQDTTIKQYILPTWPDANVIVNRSQYDAFAYGWAGRNPNEYLQYFQAPFMASMIRKGPVLTDYSLAANRDWTSEGDTPQFMAQFPWGLQDLTNYQPTWGGMGGRFTQIGPTLWTDSLSYMGFAGRATADYTPFWNATPSGSLFGATTLAHAADAGSAHLDPADVSNLQVGDVIHVGSGLSLEQREIASMGTAQSATTTLFSAASAGATNVKVNNAADFFVGAPMSIDTGANLEYVTVTAVGTQARTTTLAAAVSAGATNVKLANTTGLSNGDTLNIDTTGAMEPVTITNVGSSTLNTTTTGASTTIAAGSTTVAAGSTTLAAASAAGATNVKVASVTNFFPSQTITLDAGANLETATVAAVGTSGSGGTGLTLAAALVNAHASGAAVVAVTPAGTTDLKTAAITNFLPGQTVTIDAAGAPESATLAVVGLGGSTTLGLPSAAGDANIKILSTSNFVAGTRLWIDAGANLETAMISTDGPRYPAQGADQEGTRAAGATTTAADSAVGATTVKVASVTGFLVGAPITIDSGGARETNHITFVGTAGATGTGIDLAAPLTSAHATGAQFSAAGLTFTTPLTKGHAAGAAVSANGVTLTAPLAQAHTGAVTLAVVTPAGLSTLKVASVSNFLAGRTITIDTGANQEIRTIASVGTAGIGGTGITLTAPTSLAHLGNAAIAQVAAQAGATNIKLTSVTGLVAGATLVIDTGANAETVTVTAVGASGAGGTGVDFTPALALTHIGAVAVRSDGTGVDFTPALTAAHASGATVTDAGAGITFTPALALAHTSGRTTRRLSSGITLKTPLSVSHAAGEPFQSDMSPYYPQARWAVVLENDFAVRADWQLKSFAEANHPPVPSVPARAIFAKPGDVVSLTGAATDPDGNALAYSWWQYRESGSYPGAAITINNANTADQATFVVPADAANGDTIHMVFQVTDSGAPPLVRFQRVVVTVGSGATITTSAPTSVFGQPVTFTAGIPQAYGFPMPTGDVQFIVDGANMGAPLALDATGHATLTTAFLAVGAHEVRAVYAGDGVYGPATSDPLTQTITGTAPCLSGNIKKRLTVEAGQALCFAPGTVMRAPVTVNEGGSLDIEGATIIGAFRVIGAASLRICGATMGGSFTVGASTGLVLIGGDLATGPCAGNTITGPVHLMGNTAGVEFNGNQVNGALTINGTTGVLPAPDTGSVHAEGNTVTGPIKIK